MSRPTLEQVARAAGVSRATVSRVVNGSATVGAPAQEAVRRAVAELGYVPNPAARSLVTQRTDSVALILPENTNRVFSDDQFFPGVIRGVSQELEAAGKQLVLMLVGSSSAHERAERYTTGGHVDGVLFASLHGTDPLPELLLRRGVPVVCSGRPLGSSQVPYVDVDQHGGVAAAVAHLQAAGRRRIATIAGPPDMVAGKDRLAAYQRAVSGAWSGAGAQARGLDRAGTRGGKSRGDGLGGRSIVATGDFTRDSGKAAMRRLLAEDPTIDAVFAASDLMAHGALAALREAGRRVPDDVAVVGFDDIALARYTEPPLTTVRQPIEEIGRTVARQLLRLLTGALIEGAVVLPTELVIRESA